MRHKNGKLIVKYMWSYIAIIVVTFTVVLSLILAYTNRFFEGKTLDFAQGQLQECIHVLDRLVNDSRQVSIQASLDRELTVEKALSDKVSEYNTLRKLITLKQSSPYFSNILLHYYNTEELFTCGAKYRFSTLTPEVQLLISQRMQQTPMMPTILPITSSESLLTGGTDMVAIAYTLPYGSQQPFGLVGCMIEQSVIRDIFAGLEQDYRVSLFICNANGQLIYEQNSHEIQNPLIFFEGSEETVLYEDRLLAIRKYSELTGISAVLLVEEDRFFAPIAAMNLLLIVVTGLIVMAAILLNIYVSRKNITPIVQLREYILLNDFAEAEADLSGLLDSVRNVYSANQVMTEQLQARKHMILNNALSNIAFGHNITKMNTYQTTLEEMGVSLVSNGYIGACIKLKSQGVLADKVALEVDDFMEKSDLCGRIFTVSMTENDRFVLLGLIPEQEDDCLTQVLEDLKETLKHNGVLISVSLGHYVTSAEEIYLSVAAACSFADREISRWGKYPGKESEPTSWLQISKSQLMINQLIKTNKVREAIGIMEELMDTISASSYTNKTSVCVNVILNTIDTEQRTDSTGQLEGMLNRLLNCTSVAQVKEDGTEIISYLCEELYSRSQNLELCLFNDIVRFIQENYNNDQISLEYISGKFNVSIYYISKFFKNIAGYNFNQYVTMLRMRRAKELLTGTNKTLREITLEIGYADESSFSRKFKVTFGETPGQYRKREKT